MENIYEIHHIKSIWDEYENGSHNLRKVIRDDDTVGTIGYFETYTEAKVAIGNMVKYVSNGRVVIKDHVSSTTATDYLRDVRTKENVDDRTYVEHEFYIRHYPVGRLLFT